MKVLTFLSPCSLQTGVLELLSSPQFFVDMVTSARDCLQCARRAKYQALIIGADPSNYGGIMLLVKLLREEQPNAAIFILAQELDLDQRLHLFNCDIDDCLQETISSAEFAVRLSVSMRLRQAASNLAESEAGVLRSGDVQLNLIRRTVNRRGKPIDLRPKEFLLLEYLVRNANRLVTRTMILESVWKTSYQGLTNVVDVYISSLRSKLDRDFAQKLIQTNRGLGYTFSSRVAAPVDSRLRDLGSDGPLTSAAIKGRQVSKRRDFGPPPGPVLPPQGSPSGIGQARQKSVE
jgi:two-component system, OmpR family, response regulator